MDRFVRRFDGMVAKFPHRPAVSDENRSLSFLELDADSDRLAAILSAEAGGENRLFAYLGRMTAECVSLNVAAGKSGTAVVALDPAHPTATLRELLEHSGASAIVTTREFEGWARELMDRDPIFIPMTHPVREEIPHFERRDHDPDWLHFMSYTSGSTGRPKGIMVSRRIMDIRWEQKLDFYGTQATDVCAMFSTFWWYKHVWPLAVGAEVACFDFARQGLRELDLWMREKRVSVLLTYTAMYRQLAETARTPFPDLRQVIIGGEAARIEDVRRFDEITGEGAELMIRLACQELGPLTMFVHRHGDPIAYEKVPLGRILRPDRVKLLDEDGREVPDGEPGEITATGDFVPPGYHNDPERTAAQFRHGPDGVWTFAMGDLAVRDASGVLHSMGRRDQQVKIRGYTVRPHEVEEKLLRHPGVREAAVTAFEGSRGIRRLAGFYVPEGTEGPCPAELRDFLAENLPNYQIPSVFVVRDSLPRTANGKLDRRALPEPVEDRAEGEWAATQARTDTEGALALIWANVLGHHNFGLEDDFFDIGGDSLQAMTMLLEAEHASQARVPLEYLVLNGATIATLAAQLDANRSCAQEFAPPRALKRGSGSRPPIFAAHVQGGHLSDYLSLLSALGDQTVLGLHPRGMFNTAAPDITMQALAEYCAESILRHSPDGRDLRIMGYSFGGILAFETARALESRGAEVSHLVLLDPPALWVRPARYARAVKSYFHNKRTGLTGKRMLGTARAVLGMGPPPESLDDAHFIAVKRYVARPFPVRNALLVSAAGDPLSGRYREEWLRLIGPGLATTIHPGSHFDMIRPPYHLDLARKLEAWLDADGPAVRWIEKPAA
jgi:acyl-coenzyme A synthetase/AMP-(fatty) acid ligase/thioesterase domain-containing protein